MIITISHEFGSGGHELGKYLSDALGIALYDQKILDEVARLHNFAPNYIERISDTDIRAFYTMRVGRGLTMVSKITEQTTKIHASRLQVIKKFANQSDCVVTSPSADVVLRELSPMNLFVYSDQQSKLQRCIQRAENGESARKILRQMRQIDHNRAMYWELISGGKWGRKENYHLCIDTSGKDLKTLVPGLCEYIKYWFSTQ